MGAYASNLGLSLSFAQQRDTRYAPSKLGRYKIQDIERLLPQGYILYLCILYLCILPQSCNLRLKLLHVPDRIIDPSLAGGVVVGRQTHPGLAVGQGQAVDTVGVDVVLEGHPRVGQGGGVEEGVLNGHRAVVEGVPDEGGGSGLIYVKLHREVVRAVGVLAGVAAEGVDGAAVGEGIGGNDGIAEDGGGGDTGYWSKSRGFYAPCGGDRWWLSYLSR